MRDVGAQRAVGIHCGTFKPGEDALGQAPIDLAAARAAAGIPETQLRTLAIGETVRLKDSVP